MMLDGAIRDGCTLSAWGLYLLWKARQCKLAHGQSNAVIGWPRFRM